MIDVFPDIQGLPQRWGNSVINCPFCQGFEHRGRPWGILVHRSEILDAAEVYLSWTRDLVLFIAPEIVLPDERRLQLERTGMKFVFGTIASLEGAGGELSRIIVAEDASQDRESLLIWPCQIQCDVVVGSNCR